MSLCVLCVSVACTRKAATAPPLVAQVSGTLDVTGLSAPVRIVRDRWGVPHIYAQRQDDLFVAGAELATAPEARGRLEAGVSRLDDGMVTWLEQAIDGYMAEVDLPPKFVIPGGTQLSAQLDVARSVLRRAERRIVTLASSEDLSDSTVLKHVNRASDLLFAMARFADVSEPELFEGRGRSSAGAK